MNDLGKQTILQMKYARIIAALSKMMSIDEAAAMDMFYNSETMQLINDGVGDLHCRSDLYLAEEIIREYKEKMMV
ncbi:MAG: DUF3791 domain-containing protein [Paludibacteraceae bacterium]|nr:DUF3791 domain-containing protein [Paludibacteraceae bacterium]